MRPIQIKNMKLFSALAFSLLLSVTGFAQVIPPPEFSKPSQQELSMTSYQKDPEASGVVLYERGRYYVDLVGDFVKLIKEVHIKTKVIDAKNFDHAVVEIPYYSEKNNSDKITHLKAITHNGKHQTYVKSEDIFDADEGQNYTIKKFTFPNIKDGSVLEYTYRIETGHFADFGGWSFQGELPVMYSEFVTEIPGNYVYRRSLIGNKKLDYNDVSLKKHCFSIPGYEVSADCEVSVYMMKDMPAFKVEKYMLSPQNYLSRVDFELIKHIAFDGNTTNLAKDWDDVDKFFRFDKDMGRQLKYQNYFKDKLPPSILNISDDLERAKAVYYFIQDHFTWNGYYRIFSDIRVKEAFEEKSGNNSEINLAMLNAMEAANLDAKIMLLSTREHGLPREAYPVYTDFNYAIGFLKIGDSEYLLDATNKLNPFGIIPFRALNIKGRVMDFKNGSYWHPIEPNTKNVYYSNSQLSLGENFVISGKVQEVSTGYIAVNTRNEYGNKGESDYVADKQKMAIGLSISDYKVENLSDLEEPLKENFQVAFEPESVTNQVYLYPFFMETYFSENPFKLEERNYPVEFGFPISLTYMMSLDLNDLYTVKELPSSKIMKLPQDSGECSVVYSDTNGKVGLRFTLKLNDHRFGPEAYISLKEFFDKMITLQTKEPIILEKT